MLTEPIVLCILTSSNANGSTASVTLATAAADFEDALSQIKLEGEIVVSNNITSNFDVSQTSKTSNGKLAQKWDGFTWRHSFGTSMFTKYGLQHCVQ